MTDSIDTTSTRPYLIRALHEWCCDNGLTPYVAVRVDEGVQVPREFVKNGEIVLNVSADATSSLKLDNDFILFKARFAGVAREVVVPMNRVMAIYARENGQGMAFPMDDASGSQAGQQEVALHPAAEDPAQAQTDAKPSLQLASVETEPGDDDVPPKPSRPKGGAGRPALKRVK